MDLTTSYLGFKLPHPLIPGASPMADDLDTVRRLEDAGAPMIIMHSLFQEQIQVDQIRLNAGLEAGDFNSPEANTYLPRPEDFRLGPDEYLTHIARIKQVVSCPVVASLNGTSTGGWIDYARKIEQAGANALELNLYDPIMDLDTDSATAELEMLEVIRAVRESVQIPVAVKISPFYTAVLYFARRVACSGVKGLVLFNRFYQPDIDVEKLDLRRDLKLSTSDELLPRLRWAAALSGRVDIDLSITGGVHTVEDAVKCVMVGAHSIQLVSALLQHGPGYLATLRRGMERWLEMHEYSSLEQMRGSLSLLKTPNPSAYERGNYMQILQTVSY